MPTLKDFVERFIEGYARANRQKPSGIAGKLTILHHHLVPRLGHKALDAITTVLNVLLKRAVEWDVIEHLPCTIRLLPTPKSSVAFHDFSDYERLVSAAEQFGPQTHLLVLLGGEAGLRCGEMMALEWADVDLQKRQLCVQRSEWKGQVTSPKGGPYAMCR